MPCLPATPEPSGGSKQPCPCCIIRCFACPLAGLQAMGENVLPAIQEFTRVLATDPPQPQAGDASGSVYFDLWGRSMVSDPAEGPPAPRRAPHALARPGPARSAMLQPLPPSPGKLLNFVAAGAADPAGGGWHKTWLDGRPAWIRNWPVCFLNHLHACHLCLAPSCRSSTPMLRPS